LRWWIGGLLFASTVINYIDRQTLSLLAPYLKLEYHRTNSDYANSDHLRSAVIGGALGAAGPCNARTQHLVNCCSSLQEGSASILENARLFGLQGLANNQRLWWPRRDLTPTASLSIVT
jgi:hypothetical protein